MSDAQPPAAAQPPAGWYPDPQNAQQQRYWDGATWTAHTAGAGAAAAPGVPTGTADMAGGALPTGAPTWQMGASGMPGAAKPPFFKRKVVWIPGLVVLILIVLVVVVVVFGKGGDHSSALENAIKSNGQQQFQADLAQSDPGATVAVNDVHCVEVGSTQQYNCLIHLTVTESSGTVEHFIANATGSCNSKINAHCLWHTTGTPQQTAG